jgi:transposase InsO family protein
MTIYGSILPKAALVARLVDAGPKARQRLKILDWHQKHGQNSSLTARRFGIQRLTLRRWIKRTKIGGIAGLNDKSHRPRHLRIMTTPWATVMAVVELRKQYPAWSKYKIKILLAKKGIQVSASTIGRILKKRGLINQKISTKRQRAALTPKARFPKGLKISNPGDLIQIDTKYIMLVHGYKFYQFTAIDVLTKMRILRVYQSQSSRNGRHFLEICLKEFPFKIRAIQTDNGAPFLKEFDQYCKQVKLTHYFIYPRSPKQNTYVEISHGADKREFYLQGNNVKYYDHYPLMQQRILAWQKTWNEVRPHQALNYLTPKAYLEKWQQGNLPTRDVINLQT